MSGSRVPFLDLREGADEWLPEVQEAVAATVASGWYVLGPAVERFEASFAGYVEARHAVGVGNGLDALVLSLRAVGVGPGDEVIVPSDTYIATWLAVSAVGAVPVPVEPVPGRWTMDPERVEPAITSRTRAILPVHLYGRAAPVEDLLTIARERGLRVVEDAAQAHGARSGNRRIGAHGDAVAWSFYPTKNLGCLGDGGAVTTDDPEVADRVRLLRNYGSRRKYDHLVRGVNSRLDEVQAAVLEVKLRHLDAWNARRLATAGRYLEALADMPWLRLPDPGHAADHVWHLFVVDCDRRDALQAHLAEAGVETLIHYPTPPHRSGAYRDLGIPGGSLPVAERAARTHLSLPLSPHVPPESIQRVIDSVRSFS